MVKGYTFEVYLEWIHFLNLCRNTQDLCMIALSRVLADQMVGMDIYNHRFHTIVTVDENLSGIVKWDVSV